MRACEKEGQGYYKEDSLENDSKKY